MSKITNEISKLYSFPIFDDISYGHLKVSPPPNRKFYINSFKFYYQYLEKVYSQNDYAEVVYLILSGQFEIRQSNSSQGTTYLGILGNGELIGEHEILSQNPLRMHSIVCTSEQGELLAFDSQFFRAYVY